MDAQDDVGDAWGKQAEVGVQEVAQIHQNGGGNAKLQQLHGEREDAGRLIESTLAVSQNLALQ
jgi:hypothetical protein